MEEEALPARGGSIEVDVGDEGEARLLPWTAASTSPVSLGGSDRFVVDRVQGEPLLVAVLAPCGEMVFGDGAAIEALMEHGEDFGKGDEPIDEIAGLLAVVEAVIDSSRISGGRLAMRPFR